MHTSCIKNQALLGLLVGLLAGVFAQTAAAQPLPTDLDAVPRDATCFMHFPAAELWNHKVLADLRYLVKRAGAPTLKTFQEMFAPNPADIDRVTLVMPTPRDFNDLFPYYVRPDSTSPLVIVHTKKPFEYLRVLEKFAFRDKFYRRHHYYFNEEGWRTLVMLDAQTFLFGAEQSLFHYFELKDKTGTKEDGPLQAALREATGKHLFTVGINPHGFTKEQGFPFIPRGVQPMFQARSWIGTARLDQAMHLHVRLDFADEAKAKAGKQAGHTLIQLGRNGIKMGIQEIEKELLRDKDKVTFDQLPQKFAMITGLGLLREGDRILGELPVQRKQNIVAASLKYDKLSAANNMTSFSLYLASALSMRGFGRSFGSTIGGKDDTRDRHLKRIAQALEKYHQAKGSYPPAAVYDKYGRPILSWRVALLPYFGEQEKQLYSQFRFNEPWDGPNNKKLISQLPQCYRSPNYHDYRSQGKTVDLIFTGKGTIFEGPKGVHKKDVAPTTVLLIMGNSQTETYWSKPGDVRIEPSRPLPDLFPRYGGDVYAMLADGSFRTIPPNIGKKELRAMIYRKKGKVVADPAPKYPQAAWQDFIQIDDHGAKRALQAIRKLAAAPDKALPFLKSKLKRVKKLDRKRIDGLIANLGSRKFRTRALATGELTKAGVLVLDVLKQKLQGSNMDLETRLRIQKIVSKAQQTTITPDELRAVRAVLVLQQIGNAEARSLLTEYAQGAEDAILTAHARKALRVLTRR